MREATALRQRVEIRNGSDEETIIAGFRDDGRFSIYFGPDPVYHFSDEGQLRRGYVGGHLFRTQGSTLARLTRQRSEQQSNLMRHDLDEEELQQFLTAMDRRLSELSQFLQHGQAQIVKQIPAQPSLLPKLLQALQCALCSSPRLAAPIKGRRK